MVTLKWLNTRKNTPMVFRGSLAQAMLKVMFVRAVFPNHPMHINGAAV